MNITLKTCISENNRLSKSFSGSGESHSFDFKGESSVFNPTILIATSSNITGYNYAEISDFGRKYFITDITVIRAGLYQVELHVDVLSTYESQIRALTGVIRRNENLYNLYLDDNEFKVYNKEDIDTFQFPSGFSKSLEYVLATVG